MLRALNEHLLSEALGHHFFISMAYAVYNTDTHEFSFSSAGHPPLLLRHAGGSVEALSMSAPALGINANVTYGASARMLGPGDALFLYTDGVTDVQQPGGELFGRKRLFELAAALPQPPEAAIAAAGETLEAFGGGAPFPDDATLLAFSACGQSHSGILRLPAAAPSPPRNGPGPVPGVHTARENGCVFFSITGSGTWKESQALLETARQARENGEHTLILDFEYCTHLDSTFMGTLHKLCAESDAGEAVELRLQNVPRDLLNLMSELGLAALLLHYRQRPKPLPEEMEPVDGQSPSGEWMGQLLLSAHEALVEADPKNADRFAEVLKCLRDRARHAPLPGA